MKIAQLGLLSTTILLMALPLPSQAQSQYELPPEGDGPYRRDPEASEAIARLKSPYCPGLMLEVCPSAGGAALRDSIESLADEGLTADSIVEWVLGRHGEDYRALPKREGKALVAWVVPPMAVLTGLTLVGVALRRMRRKYASAAGSPRDLTAEDEERLVGALAELEAEEEAPLF